MSKCHQCKKPALFQLQDGVSLCLSCYSSLHALETDRMRQTTDLLNALQKQKEEAEDDLHRALGFPVVRRPTTIQHHHVGDTNINAVTMSGGTIGAITAGNAKSINVSLREVRKSDKALADLLEEFTSAVVNSTTLEPKLKDDLVENVSFVAGQAVTAPADRKPGMIRSSLENIATFSKTSKGIYDLWQILHPHLMDWFNHLSK